LARCGIALLVALAYYLGAKIGFALTLRPHPVSVLWPPNSILLAALLLTPVRVWWVILLAAFPAHLAAQLQSNVPPDDDFMLVHQQLMRSAHWRGLCPVSDRSSSAVRSSGERRNFYFLRCVFGAFPFFLCGCGLCRHQSLGVRQLLAGLANPIYLNILAALTLVPLIVTWARMESPGLEDSSRAICRGRPSSGGSAFG
jgi:hypothetical protein